MTALWRRLSSITVSPGLTSPASTRLRKGTRGSLRLEGAVAKVSGGSGVTPAIRSRDWAWYPVAMPPIQTASSHTIRVFPGSAEIEVDKILLAGSPPR